MTSKRYLLLGANSLKASFAQTDTNLQRRFITAKTRYPNQFFEQAACLYTVSTCSSKSSLKRSDRILRLLTDRVDVPITWCAPHRFTAARNISITSTANLCLSRHTGFGYYYFLLYSFGVFPVNNDILYSSHSHYIFA